MKIKKLDGLRGLFCLMVVFYHLGSKNIPNTLYNSFVLRQSNIFVDFFFVLSGFVISLNYHYLITNTKSFFDFIKKRFIRLYPLLFYTTVLYLGFNLVGKYFLPDLINSTRSTSKYILMALDTLLFTNSTPILGPGLGINYPSWSISSEMISYFLFGLTSLFFIGKKKDWVILSIIVISIAFFYQSNIYFTTGHLGFIRGLICFNLGYFIFRFSKFEFNIRNEVELLIPIAVVLLLYFLNQQSKADLNHIGLFFVPITFTVSIFILLRTDGLLSKVLETKPMQFLGKISYSVYLNHHLLLVLVPKLLFKVLSLSNNPFNQIVVLFITISIIIYYSYLTQIFIEIKAGQFLKKLLFKEHKLETSKIS